jgi:hypothetical protein
MKPRARRQGLFVTELEGELLVYDRERHRAHCLNPTAATVFRHCDGRTSVRELSRLLSRELDVPADEGLVWLSLERLAQARLLEARPAPPPTAGGLSRRELVRRAGLAVALLPVVSSILAPGAAEAAATCVTDCTGKPNGTPCYVADSSGCSQCGCNGGACLENNGTGPGPCLI